MVQEKRQSGLRKEGWEGMRGGKASPLSHLRETKATQNGEAEVQGLLLAWRWPS